MSLKPAILKEQFTAVEASLPRELGNGLVLRYATPEDSEPLAQFNGRIHGRDHFDASVAVWTRDFVSPAHPTCGPSNVTIVEDMRENKIVSSMCLIPQTWTYAGIPFEVGRVEAVGTDSQYRRSGLVRIQFEVLHAKSAKLGHSVQGITGIPWFYRQFGYEYALNLGGARLVPFGSITPLGEGVSEPYRLRPMTLSDVPFARTLYDRECERSLVVCPRPDWLWRQLLSGYSPGSFECRPFQIIETADSGHAPGDARAVGYVAPSAGVEQNMYLIGELAVAGGESLRAVMPSVLRGLQALAQARASEQNKPVNTLFFQLGPEHPVYAAIPEKFAGTRPRYGWYIRVADVPGFIRHIGPALEDRLSHSPVAGHTGELKIGEYTGGLRLVFEKGKLVTAEAWTPGDSDDVRAAFPPFVFLQLLFGYNSLAELRTVYPDCYAWGDEQVLVEALFPKRYSFVTPVG